MWHWRNTAKEMKILGIHITVYLSLLLLVFPVFRSGYFFTVILGYDALMIYLSLQGEKKGISIMTYVRLMRYKLGKTLASEGGVRMLRKHYPLQLYRKIHNI